MQNNAWEWTTEATAIKSTRIACPEYGVFRQLEDDDDLSANVAGDTPFDISSHNIRTYPLIMKTPLIF